MARAALAAVGALTLSSCALAGAAAAPEPSAPVAWRALGSRAATEASVGRYGIADRMLADFVIQYAGTAEAADASYWRALYRADPGNRIGTPSDATALVDSALAMPLDSAQRSNFLVLRRISVALERRAAPSTTTAAVASESTTRSESSPQSDEVQRLKSELARANAELERIKKRVAQPKP